VGRGYTVHVVGESLPAGSSDANVIAAALRLDAIVVTTDAHFRHMKEGAAGSRQRLQSADRIYFTCDHDLALQRITELIDVVERDYPLLKAAGRKFFMRITAEGYTVSR
jgi:hypothetical protein